MNRSSEALTSIWRPQSSDRAAMNRSSSPERPPPATLGVTPQQHLLRTPSAVNNQLSSAVQSRPAHYEFIDGIEGYAGHRPRRPAAPTLGSGGDSWVHSPPRTAQASQLRGSASSPYRVKMLSHGRGMYVD